MRYLLILLLTGCVSLRPSRPSTTFRDVSSPQRCASLAYKAEVQHILAILFGGAATAGSGIAPALSSNTIEQDITLGVAGVFGLAGAVLSYTAGVASANYSKECP